MRGLGGGGVGGGWRGAWMDVDGAGGGRGVRRAGFSWLSDYILQPRKH